jgi:hypothetical protein
MPSSATDEPATAALLTGVDRAAFTVALAGRLRDAGVDVGMPNAATFTRALGVGPLWSRSELYWLARVSLVHRQSDIAAFDLVFAAVFAEARLEVDPPARRGGGSTQAADGVSVPMPGMAPYEHEVGGLPWATLPTVVDMSERSESPLTVPERAPSDLAGLADTPFEDLDPDQLERIGAWLETALLRWPARRTRRLEPRAHGRHVDLRATLARSRRTGWEPMQLIRSAPRYRPRRVVLLCDVSQSMQAHATAYLHLMRAAVLAADAEVFAFATTLTRLTPVLAHSSVTTAIEQATAAVDDRFGGTRIATNLRALLRSRHSGVVRGAVVIIASDGWDSDDPLALAAAMAGLHRRAHRVIWMNPRVASEGFVPLVGAMAAALPYCDDLLPAHNLRALGEAVDAVSRLTSRTRTTSRA